MRGWRDRTSRMARGRCDAGALGGFLRGGIRRSRANGCWDRRRLPKPQTILKEQWTARILSYQARVRAEQLHSGEQVDKMNTGIPRIPNVWENARIAAGGLPRIDRAEQLLSSSVRVEQPEKP